MKKKITIALDETILSRIDKDVADKKVKNRSSAIESHLVKYYGDFTDASVIIFAHDNKWDDGDYPFEIPKSLLELKGESIISRQISLFVNAGVMDIHISVPKGSTNEFKKELKHKFQQNIFFFYEEDAISKTGKVLSDIMSKNTIGEKIFISNGDNFYGTLDIEKYYNFHQKQNSDFSFCLKFVVNAQQLGNVVIQGEKIIAFVEKPKLNATYLTNSGLYITSKKFLENSDFGEHLESDFFPYIPNNSHVVGYLYSGEWEHIQNNKAFERVNGELT